MVHVLTELARQLLPSGLTRRDLLWIALPISLGYGAELAQFTFGFDYYFNQIYQATGWSPYVHDGRYVSHVLDLLAFGADVPWLTLVLALIVLAFASLLLVRVMTPAIPGSRAPELALVVPVIVLYPFLLDIFAFVSERFHIAFGLAAAALAASLAFVGSGWARITAVVVSFGLLVASLMTYQSTFNLALVFFVFAAHRVTIERDSARAAIVTRLLPGFGLAALAVIAYMVIQRLMPVGVVRFDTFFILPHDADEIWRTVTVRARATLELLFEEQSVFPLAAKVAIVALLAIAVLGTLQWMRQRQLGLVSGLFCVALIPMALVACYGITLPFYPPETFLFYRIATPLAFFTGGIAFLALAYASGWLRKLASAVSVLLIAVFVLNTGIAHQYLWAQNEQDRATALQIASRIKEHPDYRADLPLVMVGELPQDVANPLARTFPFVRESGLWGYTAQPSVHALAWSKTRVLVAFLPFREPTTAEIETANQYAAGAPCWPAPGSATIVDGVIVVVFESAGLTGVACQPAGSP